jgi:hypothetical protein
MEICLVGDALTQTGRRTVGGRYVTKINRRFT